MEQNAPDNELLELAIHREVEAYHFYMALAEQVDDPEMREVLQDFAREELEHKEKLELEVLKTGKTMPQDQQFHENTNQIPKIPHTQQKALLPPQALHLPQPDKSLS